MAKIGGSAAISNGERTLNPEALKELELAWGDEKTRERLLGYAYTLVRNPTLEWRCETDMWELAADIVSEAVSKAISGTRKWDPAVTPDVVSFLCSSIKSILSSRVTSKRNESYHVEADEVTTGGLADAAETAQQVVEHDEFYYGVLEEAKDDAICCDILNLLEQGIEERTILAEKLGIPVGEIDNARKRLKRHAQRYIDGIKVND